MGRPGGVVKGGSGRGKTAKGKGRNERSDQVSEKQRGATRESGGTVKQMNKKAGRPE